MRHTVFTYHLALAGFSLLFSLSGSDAGTLGKRFVCDPLLKQIEQGFDCDCDTKVSRVSIVKLALNCTYPDKICLEDSSLCGTPTLNAAFSLRSGSNTGKACFELDNDKLFKDICISGKSDTKSPLKLSECTVSYGTERCQSCTVCESGREVTFDCSNVNVNPVFSKVVFVPGLKIDRCIGAGLLLSPNGAANSVGPFVPQP
jgi:hypothetical protein